MKKMILACSSMVDYIRAVQEKLGTNYPVTWLNKTYHADPLKMRQHILDTVAKIPTEYDTILVVMGYCGGSWENLTLDRRVVLMRVDECVSLLLHVDDAYHPDLKEKGHLYMKDKDPKAFCIEENFEKWTKGRSDEEKAQIRKAWTDFYTHVDIVDTGMYDCRGETYLAQAQKNADWIGGSVQFRKGGTLLIEKLLSGQWDEQFAVCEPGEKIGREKYDLCDE